MVSLEIGIEVVSMLLPLLEKRQLFIASRGEVFDAAPTFRLFATQVSARVMCTPPIEVFGIFIQLGFVHELNTTIDWWTSHCSIIMRSKSIGQSGR